MNALHLIQATVEPGNHASDAKSVIQAFIKAVQSKPGYHVTRVFEHTDTVSVTLQVAKQGRTRMVQLFGGDTGFWETTVQVTLDPEDNLRKQKHNVPVASLRSTKDFIVALDKITESRSQIHGVRVSGFSPWFREEFYKAFVNHLMDLTTDSNHVDFDEESGDGPSLAENYNERHLAPEDRTKIKQICNRMLVFAWPVLNKAIADGDDRAEHLSDNAGDLAWCFAVSVTGANAGFLEFGHGLDRDTATKLETVADKFNNDFQNGELYAQNGIVYL